jgi:carbon storage regulator CsrA
MTGFMPMIQTINRRTPFATYLGVGRLAGNINIRRCTILVLTRKADQQILIGDNIVITIVEIRGGSTRIGIDAPAEIEIIRPDAKCKEKKDGSCPIQ